MDIKKYPYGIILTMKKNGINVFEDEDVSKHLSFGVGGKVKFLAEVTNLDEITLAIKLANKNKIPYMILGGGYNVVFSNKKWNGLVIKIADGKIIRKDDTVYSEAGASLAGFIKVCTENGLSGPETLSGIPGTIGGAVYGNAGAYGHSISEFITFVTIFDGKTIKKLEADKCLFCYRDSIFKKKNWVILGAGFKMLPGDSKKLIETSEKIISTRYKKFGKEPRCPGSYFKNVLVYSIPSETLKVIDSSKIIEGKIPAGYLLESVGAKGMRVGGIYVADYHGNIILNDGTGKYADLIKLTKKLKKLVKAKFGILLEEEVVVID